MSMASLDVAPLDPCAYELLAGEGLGAELFNARQHIACELIERYAGELAADLCRREGLDALLASPHTAEELRRARGWGTQILPALSWVLARLAADGSLVRDGESYRLAHPLGTPRGAVIRQRGLETDASYAPAYELLDEAAAAFPAVARGETTGEQALFGKLALWIRYFDNRNAYYALNNRVAARAVADRLAVGANVLEVGAGLGSASEALLEELAARHALAHVAAYRATEPVPLFRRRAERVLTGLHPTLPLHFAVLDLNEPWTAQEIAPASQQLVWGVNVFHLARDLDAVLAEARTALAPGGWLVAGEGIRPAGGTVVGAEFPFRLLDSFTSVRLNATRATPGFLTAEEWQAAFARAGFVEVMLVPDLFRLRAYYPGMLAAAVCGRKS
jgi:SAM-dependent methyltransferase